MQNAIEDALNSERFGMQALVQSAWPLVEAHEEIAPLVQYLQRRLGSQHYLKLAAAILRHVFLIELVKVPKIDSTKFRFRWSNLLAGDPRFCSFIECVDIARDLLADLARGWLDEPENDELLKLCFDHSLLPYEVPLDYKDRLTGSAVPRIHQRGNLLWTYTPTMLRTLKLRQYLTQAATSPDATFFKVVLENKIKVKTYLTDRVLTGSYKTNREKRWEVHPNSVHFANRRTCMEIEYALIEQLCSFADFSTSSQKMLQAAGILPAELVTYRCPITLDPMSFTLFHNQLLNPVAGKSDFQVGHLNPLKLDDPTSVASGHSSRNIAWVSADGNRMQGSLSLAELRSLLRRITLNYEVCGLV